MFLKDLNRHYVVLNQDSPTRRVWDVVYTQIQQNTITPSAAAVKS